jgi:hypothetical protein
MNGPKGDIRVEFDFPLGADIGWRDWQGWLVPAADIGRRLGNQGVTLPWLTALDSRNLGPREGSIESASNSVISFSIKCVGRFCLPRLIGSASSKSSNATAA